MIMKQEPLIFSFKIEDFDLGKIPISPDLLRADRRMLESAVSDYYAAQFSPLGGEARISIAKDTVTVRWIPESGLAGLIEHSISLLQRGEYVTAVPMLQSALQRTPDDPDLV